MVKMRSKLLSKSTSVAYVLVFIVVAVGLYYLFRDNFKTREVAECNAGPCGRCEVNRLGGFPESGDANCITACANCGLSA